ncbi:hypothetical protein AK812_SmicGene14957 [Symbiodinium microadriaticum]|uniref:Uncharacterized protein n=1 Tax=Symbiodinium microadriaticum TaxID=2951 RepID=A0A1Q9E463_SYMMI|nr:hypothetical protein AK812_SmicGene14957 [Symbiodinium microadriaticum]
MQHASYAALQQFAAKKMLSLNARSIFRSGTVYKSTIYTCYEEALQAASLGEDLNVLPGGDQVSMARAAYHLNSQRCPWSDREPRPTAKVIMEKLLLGRLMEGRTPRRSRNSLALGPDLSLVCAYDWTCLEVIASEAFQMLLSSREGESFTAQEHAIALVKDYAQIGRYRHLFSVCQQMRFVRARLLRAPIDRFFDKQPVGRIMSRLVGDLASVDLSLYAKTLQTVTTILATITPLLYVDAPDMNGLLTDVMSSTASLTAAIRAYGDEERLSKEMPGARSKAGESPYLNRLILAQELAYVPCPPVSLQTPNAATAQAGLLYPDKVGAGTLGVCLELSRPVASFELPRGITNLLMMQNLIESNIDSILMALGVLKWWRHGEIVQVFRGVFDDIPLLVQWWWR